MSEAAKKFAGLQPPRFWEMRMNASAIIFAGTGLTLIGIGTMMFWYYGAVVQMSDGLAAIIEWCF